MSDNEVCLVIHFNGELNLENGYPVYNGGDQKMIFISIIRTYSSLVQKVIEVTNWEMHDEYPYMQYLYHNGRAFTLISLKSDDDVHTMFKALRHGMDAIYLYVRRNSDNVGMSCQCQSQSRPQWVERFGDGNKTSDSRSRQRCGETVADTNVRPPYPSWDSYSRNSMTHTVPQITSIGVEDQAGPSKRGLQRLNVSSMSPIHLNINTPAPSDAPQMETKSADVLPFDNLQDNADMHSSYATDDTAAEIDVVPEDDNDGGSEKDMDTEDDAHLDGGQQLVGRKESTPPIPEGYIEPCNPAQECSVVDTLIPDPDQIGDEHVESSSRDMWKGRRFPDRESFRTTLKKFAMYNNFALKPIKTSRMEVTARCGDPNCPWRIHASIVESGPQFQVKTYKQNHSCSKPMMGLAHRQATSELVAEFIKERVRIHPNYTPKKIISDFQLEFGVVVSYRKAWMAKEIAMHDIRGSYEESFKILPDYCLELQRTNPGTITHLLKEDDNSFSKFFWAFGSSIQSFCSSLRPLIAVDGAQLRGKYPGVLFCAMTYDGDHRLFPLAFAIVESEDQETWVWFLAAVDNALGPVQNLTIVTGQQENLISAVQQKLPNASHCYCVRHISQNLHSVFKDDGIVAKFWNAARAYRPFEYERHMNDIRNISEEAHTWIEEIGKQYWANAFVEGRRYDMLTTNMDEFTNSLLKDVKELPITKQVEAIRSKLMEIYESRRHSSQMMQTMVTPYAEKVLNAEAEHASQLGACAASQFEFQIHSAESVDVVHLDRRSCSCRKWNILGIPCSHAVAAIKLKGLEPYDFCEHWFSTETYRSTYNDIVHATRDMGQWEKNGMQVLPPRLRRPPGRPKKIRIREKDRQRNQVTCSYCKQKGHNRKTCHNSPLRCFLLTPKLLSDMEYSDTCSILNIMNGPCIEKPAKVTSKKRLQRRELSCHSSSSTAPPSSYPHTGSGSQSGLQSTRITSLSKDREIHNSMDLGL